MDNSFKVPEELWSYIFVLAYESSDDPGIGHPSNTRSILIAVCTRWRALAKGTSALWTYISIVNEGRDVVDAARVRRALQAHIALSKVAPLRIDLMRFRVPDADEDGNGEPPFVQWHDVLGDLSPHVHRIRALHAPSSVFAYLVARGIVTAPMHGLEILKLVLGEDDPDDMLESGGDASCMPLPFSPALTQVARLRVLSIDFDLCWTGLRHASCSSIVDLQVQTADPLSISPYVRCMPLLQSLRLHHYDFWQVHRPDILLDRQQTSHMTLPSSLQYLRLRIGAEAAPLRRRSGNNTSNVARIFDAMTLQNVNELHIQPPPDSFDTIDWSAGAFQALASRSNLGRLTVICLRYVDVPWEALYVLVSAGPLEDLELRAPVGAPSPQDLSPLVSFLTVSSAGASAPRLPHLARIVLLDIFGLDDAAVLRMVSSRAANEDVVRLREFGFSLIGSSGRRQHVRISIIQKLASIIGRCVRGLAGKDCTPVDRDEDGEGGSDNGGDHDIDSNHDTDSDHYGDHDSGDDYDSDSDIESQGSSEGDGEGEGSGVYIFRRPL